MTMTAEPQRPAVSGQDRISAAFAATPEAIFWTDARGLVEGWNAALEELLSGSGRLSLGAQSTELLPVRGSKQDHPILRALRDGKTYPGLVTRGDESQLEIMAAGFGGSELSGGAVVVVRDFTQRKRWERMLFREAGFVKLIRAVAVASNEAPDSRTALRAAVEHVCALTGWPVGYAGIVADGESVLDETWLFADESAYPDLRRGTRSHGPGKSIGLVSRVTDGGIVWEGIDDPGLRGSGTVVGVPVLVGTHVEAVLEFYAPGTIERDEGLVEVMRHLATQVGHVIERERAALETADFVRRLERSNRELEDFAYVVSHDLQEPLRKIQMFASRLDASELGPEGSDAHEYLTRMLGSAERMGQLIADLLALSRVTTKGKPFDWIDLEAIVGEAIQDLEPRIEEVRGRIHVEGLPRIEADPSQMRQLFLNLIGNALKFHREGVPPEVRIGGRRDAREVVEIDVKDNGIGFEPKYAEQVFKVFHRLVGRERFEGTGIGLAICKKIVERHSGTIEAIGEPEKGATFRVRLPIRDHDRSGKFP